MLHKDAGGAAEARIGKKREQISEGGDGRRKRKGFIKSSKKVPALAHKCRQSCGCGCAASKRQRSWGGGAESSPGAEPDALSA